MYHKGLSGEQPWTMLVYDIGCLGDCRDTIVFRLLALSELMLAVLRCNGCVTYYHSVLYFYDFGVEIV